MLQTPRALTPATLALIAAVTLNAQDVAATVQGRVTELKTEKDKSGRTKQTEKSFHPAWILLEDDRHIKYRGQTKDDTGMYAVSNVTPRQRQFTIEVFGKCTDGLSPTAKATIPDVHARITDVPPLQIAWGQNHCPPRLTGALRYLVMPEQENPARPASNPPANPSLTPAKTIAIRARDRQSEVPVHRFTAVVNTISPPTDARPFADVATQECVAEGKGALRCSIIREAIQRIHISAEGYQPQSLDVTWTPDGEPRISGPSGSLIDLDKETPQIARQSRQPEASIRYRWTENALELLPLSGIRSVDSVAMLAPGVFPAPQGAGNRGPDVSPGLGTPGQFSVNGLRARENNFLLDGADYNDEELGARRQGFVAPLPQSVESTAEFNIITALPDATVGRATAGQISVISRYGGAQLHLSAFGFGAFEGVRARSRFDTDRSWFPSPYRDMMPITSNGLLEGIPVRTMVAPGANTGFSEKNGLAFQPNQSGGKEPFYRIQSGVFAGGPIIPRRLFLFASTERQLMRSTQETHFSVPTVAERGIRSLPRPPDSLPASVPGNGIFSLFPYPNNPFGPYGANTRTEHLTSDLAAWVGSLKMDVAAGSHSFFIRTGQTRENGVIPAVGNALYSSLEPHVSTETYAAMYAAQPFGLASTLRFSYGRSRMTFNERRDPQLLPSRFRQGDFLLNAPLIVDITKDPSSPAVMPVTAQSIRLQELQTGDESPWLNTEQVTGAVGQVVIAGFSPVGSDPFYFPNRRNHRTFQIAESLSQHRSKWTWTAGIDLRRIHIDSTVERNRRPQIVFSGLEGIAECTNPFGCVSLAGDQNTIPHLYSPLDMAAAGVPSGHFQTFSSTPDYSLDLRRYYIDWFTQFEWRPAPSLRFSFGQRFQHGAVPVDVNNKFKAAFNTSQIADDLNAAAGHSLCTDTPGPPRCGDLTARLLPFFQDFDKLWSGSRFSWDPRIGISWSPPRLKNTVIRVGFGRYTNPFPALAITEGRAPFPSFVPVNIAAVAGASVQPASDRRLEFVTDQLGVFRGVNSAEFAVIGLSPFRPTLQMVSPAPGLTNSHAFHTVAMVEHETEKRVLISAAWVGTFGRRLLRVTTPDGGWSRNGYTGTSVQLLRDTLFPITGGRLQSFQSPISESLTVSRQWMESSASSTYHSFQLELSRRYARRFLAGSALTYSHAIDDASDILPLAGSFALPQNSSVRSERGDSAYDARLRWVSHAVLDLPGLGWFPALQFSGIYTAQTGPPFTVNTVFDVNRDGNMTDRPDTDSAFLQGGGRTPLTLVPGADLRALLASPGADGRVGRNSFRAGGLNVFDASVSTVVRMTESLRMRLRLEAFNAFNTSNYAIPQRILEGPGFGRSFRTTTPMRTLQFAVKFEY